MEGSLAEKAYQFLRNQLTSGGLQPGERLVNRTLAQRIGVSVIPVREAIGRLASEGLVELVPGSGAFVRQVDRSELDNLYVLRDALESCAAGEAAKFIDEFQLEELDFILQNAQSLSEEISENPTSHATKRQMSRWLDLETDFHQLLIQSARNPLLAKVTTEYRAIASVFDAQRNNPQILTRQVAGRTCQGKRDLLEALKKKDSEAAKAIMSRQIQIGRRSVLAFLRTENS